MPVGALIARFMKVLPAQNWPEELDNKWWWRAHLACQCGGVFLAFIALALVWGWASGATILANSHRYLGWTVSGLAIVQVLSGVFRGSKGGPTDASISDANKAVLGDHFLMTPRRLVFERIHKGLGWLALFCAAIAIVLGLITADAPRWMLLSVLLWWMLCACAFAYWQYQGRCVDTYQAIWGPDCALPGNQRAPVGIGVMRFSAQQWQRRLYRRALWPLSKRPDV